MKEIYSSENNQQFSLKYHSNFVINFKVVCKSVIGPDDMKSPGMNGLLYYYRCNLVVVYLMHMMLLWQQKVRVEILSHVIEAS